MNNPRFKNLLLALFAFVVFGLCGASTSYAQAGPCPYFDPNSIDWAERTIGRAMANMQAQGATLTCDSNHMYVYFPNGTFASINYSDDGTLNTFIFDPVTGHTTTIYYLGGIDDELTILVQDSVYGTINITDGWFGIFYPIGNPFDASIQNPLSALMMGFGTMGSSDPNDPWYDPGHHPPAPIRP